jgi:uncharacterized protein
MKIWIDGDACPKAIKNILLKAAVRTKTECTLVANHFVALPASPFINRKIVEKGFDVADDTIALSIQKNDVVITSDIELASRCLDKQAFAISPRGELYSRETIKQKLAMRDFNETLRGSGLHSGGPSKLDDKAINLFANHLDSLLSRFKS